MGWHDANIHGLSVQPANDIRPRLLLDLDFRDLALDLEVDRVHRLVADDERPNFAHCPLWHIEGHAFDLKFRASGFHQYFRQTPKLVSRQALPHAARGGCAFTELGFS